MLTPEKAAEATRKYWGYGLLAVAVVMAPSITYLAMNFVDMVWALAMAVFSVLLIWVVSPWILTIAQNKRLAMLKAAAAEDPISTMDNVIIEKQGELHNQEEQVITVDEQWEKVKKIVASLMRTDPDEAKSMQEAEDLLEQASIELHDEYSRAVKALDAYIHARDKASRLWEASTAINNALKIAGTARSLALQKLKSDVAFETVSNNMDQAFARLKMAVQKHQTPSADTPIIEGDVVVASKQLAEPATAAYTSVSQVKGAVHKEK